MTMQDIDIKLSYLTEQLEEEARFIANKRTRYVAVDGNIKVCKKNNSNKYVLDNTWPVPMTKATAKLNVKKLEPTSAVTLNIVPYKEWLETEINKMNSLTGACKKTTIIPVNNIHESVIKKYNKIRIYNPECPLRNNNCGTCVFMHAVTSDHVDCKFDKV